MKTLRYKKAHYADFLHEPNVTKIFEKELADKIELRCDDPNVTFELEHLWKHIIVYYQALKEQINYGIASTGHYRYRWGTTIEHAMNCNCISLCRIIAKYYDPFKEFKGYCIPSPIGPNIFPNLCDSSLLNATGVVCY